MVEGDFRRDEWAAGFSRGRGHGPLARERLNAIIQQPAINQILTQLAIPFDSLRITA
jgi:hypothetical protein